MAKKVWFWEEEDGTRHLLIDADGYISTECCCHPCHAAETVDNSSCSCYGVGSLAEPVMLVVNISCANCVDSGNNGKYYLCWAGSTAGPPLTCSWSGGTALPAGVNECFFDLKQTYVSGGDDQWILTVYDDSAGSQAWTGHYDGDWNCTGCMAFTNDCDPPANFSCPDAEVTVCVVTWEAPT